MNSTVIEKLLDKNDVIMIDTCFAMRDEFPQFVKDIEVELLARKKKIIVKKVVIAELYRLLGSSITEKRDKATIAVSTICMKRTIFDIDEKDIDTEAVLKAFADVEFLADFTKNRIKYNMALLTNDYKLGKDISVLNNLESCNGKEVEVFSLDKNGCLVQKVYTTEEETMDKTIKQPKKSSVSEIKHEDKKIDLIPVIISSISSFSLGILVNKYGDHIVNSIKNGRSIA